MHIFLRNLSLKDSKDFFNAAYEKNVFRFIPGFYCNSIETAKDTIQVLLSNPNVTAYVIASEENSFIGVIVVEKKEIKKEKESFEIFYFVNKKFRKKGYATEAIQQILQIYKPCRIYLNIASWNKASIAITKKFKNQIQYNKFDNLYILEN